MPATGKIKFSENRPELTNFSSGRPFFPEQIYADITYPTMRKVMGMIPTMAGSSVTDIIPDPMYAGMLSGFTAGNVQAPGYEVIQQRHPVQSTIGEVIGFFPPLIGAQATLKAAGLPALLSRLATPVRKLGPAAAGASDVAVASFMEGLAFGEFEGGMNLIHQLLAGEGVDLGEVAHRTGHGMKVGAMFGGTGAGVAQLPRFTKAGTKAEKVVSDLVPAINVPAQFATGMGLGAMEGDDPENWWKHGILPSSLAALFGGAKYLGKLRKGTPGTPEQFDAESIVRKTGRNVGDKPIRFSENRPEPGKEKPSLEILPEIPKDKPGLEFELTGRENPSRMAPASESRTVLDSEGNSHTVRPAIVDIKDLVVSHDAQSFEGTPGYPRILQARERSSEAGRAQVEAIGRELDPARLTGEHQDATSGPPVIWIKDGNPVVLAGNGRVMGLKRAMAENPEAWGKYRENVREKATELGIDVEGMENPVIVRTMEGTEVQAIELAARSQESLSSKMSRMEQAVSFGRSAGLKEGPEGTLPFRIEPMLNSEGLTERNVGEFLAENPPLRELLNKHLDPASKNDPAQLVDAVKHVMAIGLPENVRSYAASGTPLGDLLYESSPYLANIHDLSVRKVIRTEFDLLPHVEDAVRLFQLYSSRRMSPKKMLHELDLLARNESLPGMEPIFDQVSSESVGLAMGMLKASRLRNPTATMRDQLSRWIRVAREHDPNQVEMFEPPSTGDLVRDVFGVDTSVFQRARERSKALGDENAELKLAEAELSEAELVERTIHSRDAEAIARLGTERLLRHPKAIAFGYHNALKTWASEGKTASKPEAVPAFWLIPEHAEQAGFSDPMVYLGHDAWGHLVRRGKSGYLDRLPSWSGHIQEVLPFKNKVEFVVNDHGEPLVVTLRSKDLGGGRIKTILEDMAAGSEKVASRRGMSEAWQNEQRKKAGTQADDPENTPINELNAEFVMPDIFRESRSPDQLKVREPGRKTQEVVRIKDKKYRVERADGEEVKLVDEFGNEREMYADELVKMVEEGRAEIRPGDLESFGAGIHPREALRTAAPNLAEKVEDFIAEAQQIASKPEVLENPGKWNDKFTEWLGRRAERLEVEVPGLGKKISDILRNYATKTLTMQWAVMKETVERFGNLTGRPSTRFEKDIHKWGRETLFEVAKGVRGITDTGQLEFGTRVRSGALKLMKDREGNLFIETDAGQVPYNEVRGSYVTIGGKDRLVGEEINSVFSRTVSRPLLPGKKVGEEVIHQHDVWTVKELGPEVMVLEQQIKQPTGHIQLYREINPENARAQADALFERYPESEQILKDFVARNEEAKELTLFGDEIPAFAREPLKRQFEVNGLEDVEGAWVPDIRDESHRLGKAILNVFRPYKSPHRRYKKGSLDFEDEAIKDLGTSTAQARSSLYAEEMAAEMSGRILELIAKPYDPVRGLDLLPGYKPMTTGILSPDGWREVRAMRRAVGLLENAGIDPKTFDQATFMARGVPYQIPSKIAEELQYMFGVKAESTSARNRVLTAALGDLTRSLIRIPVKAHLTRPSTAMRNFTSQGIQTATMLTHDIYKSVFDALLTDNPAPLAELRGALWASTRHLSGEARLKYPDTLNGTGFIKQFRRETPDVEDFLLIPFHAVESGQKRFILMKSHYASAYREIARLQKEGRISQGAAERHKKALELMENPIPEEWLSRAKDDVMWHGYDYSDAPKALQAFTRWAFSRGLVPYPNYVYHMIRMVADKYNPVTTPYKTSKSIITLGKETSNAWKTHQKMTDPMGWDLLKAKNKDALSEALANWMTSWTMWGLAFWLTAPPDEEERQSRALTAEGARLPYTVDTSGRIQVHQDEDKEYWLRVADQPFIAEAAGIRALLGGTAEVSDYLNERTSTGIIANSVMALLGYRDKYQDNMPVGAILGREYASSVKLSPWLHFGRRIIDPQKRKGYDAKKGFFHNFGIAFKDYMPMTSSGLPERRGEYERDDTMLKHFFLNVKVIDKREKQEALIEAMRRLQVRELQEQLNPASAN